MEINRKDYLYHFIAGYAIALLFYSDYFPFAAIIAAAIAGIAKEIYDWASKKGDADVIDALCTIGGGIAGMLVGLTKSFIL